MEENQIEKLTSTENNESGDIFSTDSSGPLPIATNISPGIASFSPEDFTVTVDGQVQSFTKLGIAFTLKFIYLEEPYYELLDIFGNKPIKIGDVGLVLENDISELLDIEGQRGNIVKLTAIKDFEQLQFYGEILGSILGPQGIQGIQGPQGIQGKQGEQGEVGPQGEQGPVTDLSIGSVTNVLNDELGQPGEATADIIGSGIEKKLNLGIPVGERGPQGIQGPQGPEGPQGPSAIVNIVAKGPWKENTIYYRNDMVTWSGDDTTEAGSYVCSVISTEGSPSSSPDDWGFFIAEGAPGKDGAPGPVGPQGEPGVPGENGVDGNPGAIHMIGTVTYKALSDFFTYEYSNIENLTIESVPFVVLISNVINSSPSLKVGDLVKVIELTNLKENEFRFKKYKILCNIKDQDLSDYATNDSVDEKIAAAITTTLNTPV